MDAMCGLKTISVKSVIKRCNSPMGAVIEIGKIVHRLCLASERFVMTGCGALVFSATIAV